MKKFILGLSMVVVAMMGMGNTAHANTVSQPVEVIADSNMNLDTEEQTMVAIINQERAEAGLSALATDARGNVAAEIRAQEIALVFSHNRVDGSDYKTVLNQVGISYSYCGENVAFGMLDAQAAMQGLMASAAHADNIINGRFTHVGVSKVTVNGYDYWAQVFYTIK